MTVNASANVTDLFGEPTNVARVAPRNIFQLLDTVQVAWQRRERAGERRGGNLQLHESRLELGIARLQFAER